MKPSVIITMLVMALALQCIAKKQEREQLINQVSWTLLGQWMTKEAIFMGYSCDLQVQPRFSAWLLYYECSFSCTEWTDIIGKAVSRCKLEAAEDAVRNFVDTAMQNNLIRQIDASKWYEEQNNATKTF
ncbi:anti-lipopolysaccharide factor-like [Penaeus chinensis]|uniref:anti-lipopolysaccharide factor-like n=1 Tax=Penaeus chinensis TaxID=139456 RepID=UPI001FB5E176|nr:anti-lipopolysaccharide factor-like [Penaeus chinensis]